MQPTSAAGRTVAGGCWPIARRRHPASASRSPDHSFPLSELFRDLQVRRLANYFQSMHDSLVARTNQENPRVVLLRLRARTRKGTSRTPIWPAISATSGRGGDLTVRDNRVFLKSVDGLKPIDLILRRVDADECDPLELRADSMLGVAGLLQAARAGNGVMANALGSGLAETKAMLRFLQSLCRRLFGEDLRLPNTPTWWCGDAQVRDHVLDNLDRLAIDSPSSAARCCLNHQRRSRRVSLRARTSRHHRPDRHARPRVRRAGTVSLSTTPAWAGAAWNRGR